MFWKEKIKYEFFKGNSRLSAVILVTFLTTKAFNLEMHDFLMNPFHIPYFIFNHMLEYLLILVHFRSKNRTKIFSFFSLFSPCFPNFLFSVYFVSLLLDVIFSVLAYVIILYFITGQQKYKWFAHFITRYCSSMCVLLFNLLEL